MLRSLGSICRQLLLAPKFDPYADAVGHDSPLAAGLVRLLAPAFQAAAISLLLPIERRAGQHLAWSCDDVYNLAVVLGGPRLAAGMAAHLAAESDGSYIPSAALQLLQPLCQLLSRAPLDSQAGSLNAQAAVVGSCWALVGAVCSQLSDRIAGRLLHGVPDCLFDARAQRTCQQLQQQLPRLVPQLLWRAQLLNAAAAANERPLLSMLSSMDAAMCLLDVLKRPFSPAAL